MFKTLLGCIFLVLSLNATAVTMGEAIDRAGQQRMLSQRIAQTYILTALQPDKPRHQKQLNKAINMFENNYKILAGFDKIAAEKQKLNQVAELWAKYKALITTEPTRINARLVVESSNRLLKEANNYVKKIQLLSNTSSAELVNVSGRQRMLSQRIAKNYLANYWNVGDEGTLGQFYEDIAEYQTMLEFLKGNEVNTPEITKNLLKTEGHFKYASKGFDGDLSLKGERLIFVVTGTTDTMLRNMDVITKQYSAVLDKSTSVASR